MSVREILFLLVVFVSNVIQCITGFAGTVLAMPFSLMLVGYGVAKPVLNLLGIVVSIGVVATHPKSLNTKEFAKIIGTMLVGMLIGFGINSRFNMNPAMLYKLLGVVVIGFMLLGCYHTFVKNKHHTPKERTNIANEILGYCILVVAGVVHGMFVCGGPLLIVYAGEKLKNREQFRVTLSAVWIALNSVILLSDIRSGFFNSRLVLIIVLSVIVLFGALVLGNIIARRINNKVFMIITYILMGISGLSLLLK